MSKKSFANLPKPGRQPTAEEIEAFEKTGRARAAPGVDAPARTETQKPLNTEVRVADNTEKQKSVNAQSLLHGNTERRETAKTEIRHGVNTETQDAIGTETRNSVNTQTQKHDITETREPVAEGQGPAQKALFA